MDSTSLIRLDRHGTVALLTLDRPPVNALSGALLDALMARLNEVGRDPAIRAIVLTGSDRAFSAGADIKEFAALGDPEAIRAWTRRGHAACDGLAASPRPVIAAIEGVCFGGGLEVALACHLRVAAEGARLGLPEIKLGILPGFGGTQRLPRVVGPARARAMILTGDPIAADEAQRSGLVERVAPTGGAVEAALALASTIAERSATAAAAILRLIDLADRAPLTDGLAAELAAVTVAIASPDGREGTAAFLAKRPARFTAPPPT